jgi:hypothetical protein
VVYFHTVGDSAAHTAGSQYTANGGWSGTHEALCRRDPQAKQTYRIMPGCGSSPGYTTISDAATCEDARQALVPTLAGPVQGGFGTEWANGCFFNGGSVYFHTVGDSAAHSAGSEYTANGGWSAQHQALCVVDSAAGGH